MNLFIIKTNSCYEIFNLTWETELYTALLNDIFFSQSYLEWQIKTLWVHKYFTTVFRTYLQSAKQTTAALPFQKTLLATSGLAGLDVFEQFRDWICLPSLRNIKRPVFSWRGHLMGFSLESSLEMDKNMKLIFTFYYMKRI